MTTMIQFELTLSEMSIGTYYVRIQVNGKFIPSYQYTNIENAKIRVIAFLDFNNKHFNSY